MLHGKKSGKKGSSLAGMNSIHGASGTGAPIYRNHQVILFISFKTSYKNPIANHIWTTFRIIYTRWCPSSRSLSRGLHKSNFTTVYSWWYIELVSGIIIHLQVGGHHLVTVVSSRHGKARHCDTAARFPSSSAEWSREATNARPAWPVVAWRGSKGKKRGKLVVLRCFKLVYTCRKIVFYWLVVWTPLKNISQLGWLFPIYGKIKNVPNHQPVYYC